MAGLGAWRGREAGGAGGLAGPAGPGGWRDGRESRGERGLNHERMAVGRREGESGASIANRKGAVVQSTREYTSRFDHTPLRLGESLRKSRQVAGWGALASTPQDLADRF